MEIPDEIIKKRDGLAKRQGAFYDPSFGAGVVCGFNEAWSLALEMVGPVIEFYGQVDKWSSTGTTWVDNEDKSDTIQIHKLTEINCIDTELVKWTEASNAWAGGKRARALKQKLGL